ncbi:hypothetical protein Ga0466249_000556 [Sporomusaceae bacterium BoRhaA]|uniref:DUF3795 domain-containing protein n=1 Tax=Pelorhabdus rhamnosifermentans TaxID=2772457 RepID=UPI001C062BC1|nr:DUF3795 domain-containing protein [Pelorhabdus rhamnosifermentans]MBU2699477.1 hypothetical protein [Pelorhabdus rhamnosifermentans]
MVSNFPEEQFFMEKTAEEIANSIAPCGFVCGMCYDTVRCSCPGCQDENEICPIRQCCIERKIRGCWNCREFPCCECNFRGVRIRAFLRCAKEEGIEALAGYLLQNVKNGIHYHNGKTYNGDYDICETEDQVIELLHNGKGKV